MILRGVRCWIACAVLAVKMAAMRAACLFLLTFLSGCHYVVASGGSLYVATGPAFEQALAVGALAANVDARNNFPAPTGPAPEMLLERKVAEQDCTKPIEDWSANLKCR